MHTLCSIYINSIFAVPSLSCDSVQPIGGGIHVSWSFAHTGGLPLTALMLTYTFMAGGVLESRDGPEVSTDATSADIDALVTDVVYTATVEATNANGATSVQCQSLAITTGIPQPPEEPMFEELGDGNLRITVRTPASGLEPGGGQFSFLLFQTRLTQSVTRQADSEDTSLVESMSVNNYMSGRNVSFSVDDLMVGGTFKFTVQAENRFGRSGNASATITVTGQCAGVNMFMSVIQLLHNRGCMVQTCIVADH